MIDQARKEIDHYMPKYYIFLERIYSKFVEK